MQIGIIMVGTLFPLAGTGLTLAGVSLGFHRDTAPVTAAIRSVLSTLDYAGKDTKLVAAHDAKICGGPDIWDA